jgi:hypothetical protein
MCLLRLTSISAPSPQMMMQQAKQNQMQRDPSSMDGNRERPSSPANGENAPSPSKRQRVDNPPFNPQQPGGMMPNGRPGQNMPPQQVPGGPNAAAAQQMLTAHGINPQLGQPQFNNFVNIPPTAQQKNSIATYSQHLQHHHGNQMGNKQMPNAGGPQGQNSPMMPQGHDGNAINYTYNPSGEMGAPGGLRPGAPGAAQAAGGSNHALQDYQMQLMLLEQQNKKRLMMARQEQDNIGGMPREGQPPGPGGPGVPTGPNGQGFPEASPQAMRTGASPNPAEQMKRGTPQMNNSGIPSPVPEGGPQSRDSPNPAMNFMGNADPNVAPHFFNKGADGNMVQANMNGMRPPSSHPGQPFNPQMNQQMMAARQQAAAAQQGGQNPQQWQQGPNGQMVPPGMQQGQQVQGTPQQRPMPPPSAPAGAVSNTNNRTTASPQQAAAAPPTPNQSSKPAPKSKKKGESAKDKVCRSFLIHRTDSLHWRGLTFCSHSELQTRRRPTRTPTMLEPHQRMTMRMRVKVPRLRRLSRRSTLLLRMAKLTVLLPTTLLMFLLPLKQQFQRLNLPPPCPRHRDMTLTRTDRLVWITSIW